jgi:hypothetical protein
MEATQNKRFYFRVWSSSLLATYIVERRTTFAKAYAIKVWCYWECFGENIGNLGEILEI